MQRAAVMRPFVLFQLLVDTIGVLLYEGRGERTPAF